jgi:small GTP-binding protein
MKPQKAQKPAKPTEKEKVSSKERTKTQIEQLEKELSATKYNKKTQGHFAVVKSKIAMLREKESARQRGKGKTEGYTVKKSGDATVILVGFPSVGKSTLLNALTNAHSNVAAYEFTTLTCIPGLMEYRGAKIQILDVPGIVQGAAVGTGRGKEVLACAWNADLILFLVDVFHTEHLHVIKKEVYDVNIRVDQQRPDVRIVKTARGGINVASTVPLTKINAEIIAAICREFRIMNADIVLHDDINEDQFIDVIEGNKKYVPSLVVLNKADLATPEQLRSAIEKTKPDMAISAEKHDHIDELKEAIFRRFGFIRVYCKEIGKPADLKEPMIMQSGITLEGMCNRLHKDFVMKFKFARVWGTSVKFSGQKLLTLRHRLQDQDIVELHIK